MDIPFFRCPLCECGYYSPYLLVCTYNHNHRLCRRCFSKLKYSNFVCIFCRSKYHLYRINPRYKLRIIKNRPRNLILISKSPTPNHYYVHHACVRYAWRNMSTSLKDINRLFIQKTVLAKEEPNVLWENELNLCTKKPF